MKLFFCFSVLIVSLVGIAVANHLLTEFEAWKDPSKDFCMHYYPYTRRCTCRAIYN